MVFNHPDICSGDQRHVSLSMAVCFNTELLCKIKNFGLFAFLKPTALLNKPYIETGNESYRFKNRSFDDRLRGHL